MAEHVQTGGVMQFRHEGEMGKLDDERKMAIERGYQEAEERKQRERKRKRIVWGIVIVIMVLVILAIVFLRKS